MGALDRAVGDRGVDPVRPRVAIGEDEDGEAPCRVDLVQHPAGGPGGLALEVDEDGLELLVKPVLDQPVVHAAGLERDDELRVMVQIGRAHV